MDDNVELKNVIKESSIKKTKLVPSKLVFESKFNENGKSYEEIVKDIIDQIILEKKEK